METIEQARMTDALIKELVSGRKFVEEQSKLREHVAAAEAHAQRGHRTIKGLGKCLLNIPQHEFFTIRNKYGPDCWGDRGFIKDFQRLEPQFTVHKA
jgi:hypothetical protein